MAPWIVVYSSLKFTVLKRSLLLANFQGFPYNRVNPSPHVCNHDLRAGVSKFNAANQVLFHLSPLLQFYGFGNETVFFVCIALIILTYGKYSLTHPESPTSFCMYGI